VDREINNMRKSWSSLRGVPLKTLIVDLKYVNIRKFKPMLAYFRLAIRVSNGAPLDDDHTLLIFFISLSALQLYSCLEDGTS